MDKFSMKQAETVSAVLKQLAHPDRLKVLCALVDGEKSVNQLVDYCKASQSWVSQFLGKMKLAGLVESKKDGLFVYYKVADPGVVLIMKAVQKAYCKNQ